MNDNELSQEYLKEKTTMNNKRPKPVPTIQFPPMEELAKNYLRDKIDVKEINAKAVESFMERLDKLLKEKQ